MTICDKCGGQGRVRSVILVVGKAPVDLCRKCDEEWQKIDSRIETEIEEERLRRYALEFENWIGSKEASSKLKQ